MHHVTLMKAQLNWFSFPTEFFMRKSYISFFKRFFMKSTFSTEFTTYFLCEKKISFIESFKHSLFERRKKKKVRLRTACYDLPNSGTRIMAQDKWHIAIESSAAGLFCSWKLVGNTVFFFFFHWEKKVTNNFQQRLNWWTFNWNESFFHS